MGLRSARIRQDLRYPLGRMRSCVIAKHVEAAMAVVWPQTVYRPRLIAAQWWTRVPELRLQEVSTRGVYAAAVEVGA